MSAASDGGSAASSRPRPVTFCWRSLVLLIAMHFASPYFFTQGNMQNVAKNFSFIAIATLGVTFVIITGGIDLSVGSMMCFSAMITSMVMSGLSTPGMPGASLFVHMAADGKTVVANVPGLILLVSILAGLGTALIVGLVNGFCIAVLGLSPFVTTLGMLSIVRGLGYVVSNGRGSFPGGPDADYFYALTSGDLFGVPAPFIYLVDARRGDGGRAAPHHVRPSRLRARRQREGGRTDRHSGRAGQDRSLRDLRACRGPAGDHRLRLARLGAGEHGDIL